MRATASMSLDWDRGLGRRLRLHVEVTNEGHRTGYLRAVKVRFNLDRPIRSIDFLTANEPVIELLAGQPKRFDTDVPIAGR